EAILDHELDDETHVADVASDFDTKDIGDSVDTDGEDDMSLGLDSDLKGAEGDADGEFDDEMVDLESWSDDPVRMYLTQMGEIPLLTRQQEINLARRIEHTRTAFRRRVLACDYAIRVAFKVLSRVHRGELPFDRTVQV